MPATPTPRIALITVAAATLPWSQLQSGGLRPLEAAIAAKVPAVMIANATVPGLSSLRASISPTVISGVLRQQLGFQGLVITDSLSAVAISSAGYSVPQAAVAALRAGADMVLYNAGPSSVAQLTDQTVAAIVAACEHRHAQPSCPEELGRTRAGPERRESLRRLIEPRDNSRRPGRVTEKPVAASEGGRSVVDRPFTWSIANGLRLRPAPAAAVASSEAAGHETEQNNDDDRAEDG